MSDLPSGFVLDQPSGNLPEGFVVDKDWFNAKDTAKGIGAGLSNATAHMLGGAGDIREAASAGVDFLGDKLGVSPEAVQKFKNVVSRAAEMTPIGYGFSRAPTTQAVIDSATDPIVPPNFKPESYSGDYAKTVAEFAPGLLFGGRGVVRPLINNVVVPAVFSETAGQLTKGTEFEPWARAGAALVSGGGAAALEQKLANNAVRSAMPTGDKLVESGSNRFNAARDMNVIVEPNFAVAAAAKMRNDLRGFDPEAQAEVFAKANRLEALGVPSRPSITPAQRLQAEMNWEALPPTIPAQPVKMNELEFIREQLTQLKASSDGPTRAAAKRAIQSLQESQIALTPAQTISGNAKEYADTIRKAVGDYAAGKRAQTLQGKANLAELNSNTSVFDPVSNAPALQRTLKQLARPAYNTNVPIAKKLGFNDAEVAEIVKASNGNWLINSGDLINRLAPAQLGALPGEIIRRVGGMSVKDQFEALSLLVRARSPLAVDLGLSLPEVTKRLPPRAQQWLLAAQSVRQSQVPASAESNPVP